MKGSPTSHAALESIQRQSRCRPRRHSATFQRECSDDDVWHNGLLRGGTSGPDSTVF